MSTNHLEYIQRTTVRVDQLANVTAVTRAPPALRRLWRVHGVGRIERSDGANASNLNASHLSDVEPRSRMITEDAIIGLYGPKIRICFLIWGAPDEVSLWIGTWSPENVRPASADVLDRRHEIIAASLKSLYPAIELEQYSGVDMRPLDVSGLVLGTPTAKCVDPGDGALPVDRLIRALSGVEWRCLVLAEPVQDSAVAQLRDTILNEVRDVQAYAQAERAPSPLAKTYTDLLTFALKTTTSGLGVGLWRTGVYLLGDKESYPRLASVWRGIFSGDKSLPEPVRVWESIHARVLADTWALPDTPGPPPPGSGNYRRPLEYQTLLTSDQLAAYLHLPRLETRGFALRAVPEFDVVPPLVRDDKAVKLGTVMERTRPTETAYKVPLNDLTGHAFIAGVTGAGKTNTVFYLLKQAWDLGAPFLVLEPAKTEYRALMREEKFRGSLQIFTLGDEQTSPLRLNPFEVGKDIPVGVHLDLLRSAFTASFGMWTPLPQILERCLHAVYADRGWDITNNRNHRLGGNSDVADAFPTLAELAAKAEEIIQKLGYEAKITDDMRAALLTRLNGLRVGGKGSMLDVQRSLPMEMLLTRPTVLELQNMGDDDDKAFVMALLLIRLYEYRRAGNESRNLQHILVIEEAHRLLANSGPRKDPEQGDPRAKAVETFSNMLSEIRAYGQGIIVADQVPVKLAPDIIKNTNLKICHRIVASDDREAMAGAMAMEEKQSRALATLEPWQAAVFGRGDDRPVLVQVAKAKDVDEDTPPRDPLVKDYMSSSEVLKPNKRLFQPLLPEVDMAQPTAYRARDAARILVDDSRFKRDFVRLVVSMTEDDGALARLWNDLIVRAQETLQDGMDEGVMRRALITYASNWFAGRRGSQGGWSYADTADLDDKLRSLLLAKLDGGDTLQPLKSFREVMYRLHARRFEPFMGCAKICTQNPPVCLYRRSIEDFMASSKEDLKGEWNRAMLSPEEQRIQLAWEASGSALVLIEEDPVQRGTALRIQLCYAQHQLAATFPEQARRFLDDLLNDAVKYRAGA